MPPDRSKDRFITDALTSGRYYVTKDGNIVSVMGVKHRLLKQSLMSDGYCRVGLSVNGTAVYVKAHRVVAIALVPNPDGKPLVNHKDGNKQNNHPANLEWVTPAENNSHAHVTGLVVAASGDGCASSKLRKADVAEIRRLLTTTKITQAELAERYGVRQSTISMIVTNRNWRIEA